MCLCACVDNEKDLDKREKERRTDNDATQKIRCSQDIKRRSVKQKWRQDKEDLCSTSVIDDNEVQCGVSFLFSRHTKKKVKLNETAS